MTDHYENVVVPCDRCKQEVHGIEDRNGGTGGFYRTPPGSLWARFVNPTELAVCDACMHADPRYEAVYGKRPTATEPITYAEAEGKTYAELFGPKAG